MVLEGVVADLLNRFLGTYIDNLNASQLNIGIWGGDVKLHNLEVKETALDDLNLPIKLKFGYVQSLVLKIPWKNLYTEPTIVNISELYVIIVPNQGIVYSEEKWRKNEQDAKQKKLSRLEENRRNRTKPQAQTDDTFTEKLVAQVIKNLEIRIKRVHIRYEDKFSNRDRPFATGVTLNSLDIQTTDENFHFIIQREAVKIFYKLISMNHLCLYSNANSGLISDMTGKDAIIEALRSTIATEDYRPEGYKYMLEPLSMDAKLKLNQKPETDGSDWTIPKIDLALQLDKLALAIGQFQYQDLLLFLEAQERFNLSERYLKYRPNLNVYRGHYKEWWHFAYNCILNEEFRRHQNNWSFDRMRAHRQMVRQYRDAWIVFRTEKSPSSTVKNTIEEAERALDVFNLNIARQQAEFEIDRRTDLVRVEDQKQQGWVGWAKSWFGGSVETKEPSETDAKVMEKLEQAITPEEKQRLFEAIDYQEHTPPTDYPKNFVENRFHLNLDTLVVALEDVLELQFTELSAQFEQRPSADAMKFTSCINNFEMNALDQQLQQKQSMLTLFDQNRSWLCMQFETNPLNEDIDQSIQLEIAPIMLKYHAPAVNKALEVFKPPESVKLHQLTALAIARYEEVKARSATALQHMVDQRKKLKMEIQIDPATIVLSSGGIFDETKPSLIAELGKLELKTVNDAPRKAYEHISDQRLSSLMAKAYDNFQLTLSNLQLIFADNFKVCMEARQDCSSCYHLLKPTGLTFDLMRSTIDDIQLPLFRLFGELPDLVLIISDDRLVKLIELFNSIPRPEFEEEVVDLSAPVDGGTKLRDRAKMVAIMEVEELDDASFQKQQQIEEREKEKAVETEESKKEEGKPILREQQIQLDLNFNLNEVGIIVKSRNKAFLSAHIRRLGLHMRKRMFDMVAQAHLGSLTLEMPQLGSSNDLDKEGGQTIYLIDNEMLEGDHLIDITYKQATDESPTFHTEFASNEQSVHFVFQILNFNLHKDALSDLNNFNERFQRKLARAQQQKPIVHSPETHTPPQPSMSVKKRTPSQSSHHSRESSRERKTSSNKKKKSKPRRPRYEKEKKFIFEFRMHEIAAKLFARQSDIAGGIDSEAAEDAILEFCAINIQKLNLDGHMTEQGSMQVEIGLDAFTMDDRRRNAKIHRLMDKKDVQSRDKFIVLKYNQNSTGDKFVDILSSKFFLLLAPEFLGVLSSFFVFKPLEDEEEEMQLSPTDAYFDTTGNERQQAQQQTSGINISAARLTPSTPQTSPQPQATTTSGSLSLNCKIYAIEVILIENSLRPDDSQAIILTFDAVVDAKNINGVQHMDGGIQHLQMYSTYFAYEKRHLINYSILKELDILFTGAIDPKEHSQKFKVSMDQLEIRVSPSVIRLLSAVTTQFSEHQKKDQTSKKARVTLSEYPGYWEPKTIAREKFWWFQTNNNNDNGIADGEQSVDEIGEDAQKSIELMGLEQAEFSINRIVVTVEAGVNDVTRPMILLESSLQGSTQNWSTQLIGDSEARLQVSYYNENFSVWEPVIEPVLHEHSGWESWRLGLKIGPQTEEDQQQQQNSSSKSREEKHKVAPAKMAVTIEARETMNITITKSFLQLLGELSDSFEQAAKQISPPKNRELPALEQEQIFHGTRFVNMLPKPIHILVPVEQDINGGEGLDLDDLEPGLPLNFTVEIENEVYDLKMIMPTPGSTGDLQVIKLQSVTSNRELYLGLNWNTDHSRTTMSLYTPYWMVNETGRELIYQQTQGKSTDIHHLPDHNPLILLLNESDFLEKKKAKVRIADSDWSSEFPLDTAGSSGRITCRTATREYELSVDVQLSQSALTKVVTIMPFYLLQNDSKIAIEVREPNTSDWIHLPPESIIGFWPVQKAKRKTLIARFPNTVEESIQFPFTEAFEGFAAIANDFIGLYVIVYLSDDSSVVHLEQFAPGMAPAILMNDTNHHIEYWQAELKEKKTLEPGQMIPFTWNDLLIHRRLEWKSGDAAGSDELMHNRDSSYLPSKTQGYHFSISFLNGRQRVLLFTNDAGATFIAHEAYEIEQPNMEVEFRLHGIGISLVNNLKSIEIIYMSITSTEGYLSEENGFWMQYRQSDHQTTLWAKVINFQADNQLRSAVFPCMLGMVPQPRSVVKNAPKPFLECSFVMNQSEHSNVVQIKLLEALVQEFAVRLDQHLINEILDLFPKERIETTYNKESFDKDMELTQGNLNKRAIQTRVSQAKAYYERLHISPLMMHLSFSQGHAEKKDGPAVGIQWEFLNLMLESVGVTLTEIQDVTFKLAFFQREATFYSRYQLQSEIQSHYIRQFIKQAYVLVLGLDIIGNPFGLIRDLSTGVQDFFYQPIQGAVTGPLEFIDGMAYGVHSLFSHSVGGVLGVASRITGTLGKGVAALTLDDEYQRKRLQARQQPANFGEGMFRGVRAAGQGVMDGVTGVISKPVEGAKKGGVSGFLKGTGKGLVGAVTRPVSGVVDMVTSVADSVKTVVTNAEMIKPVRPPRVICDDKIIRPFVFEEGIGYQIFKEINKGSFADKEQYHTHGIINKHVIFVVTDKRVILGRQHELTGNWNADWHPSYAEIIKPELVETDGNKLGVKIQLREPKRTVLPLFNSSKTKGKMLLFANEAVAQRVHERILNAWENHKKTEQWEHIE